MHNTPKYTGGQNSSVNSQAFMFRRDLRLHLQYRKLFYLPVH